MKRCPQCRRDYYDDTLLYCLDDGSALLEGPASMDEPATAILSNPGVGPAGFWASEQSTRPQVNTTDRTAVLPSGELQKTDRPKSLTNRKLWLSAVLIAVV